MVTSTIQYLSSIEFVATDMITPHFNNRQNVSTLAKVFEIFSNIFKTLLWLTIIVPALTVTYDLAKKKPSQHQNTPNYLLRLPIVNISCLDLNNWKTIGAIFLGVGALGEFVISNTISSLFRTSLKVAFVGGVIAASYLGYSYLKNKFTTTLPPAIVEIPHTEVKQ